MKENGNCLGNIKSLLVKIHSLKLHLFMCVFEKRNELKIITDLIMGELMKNTNILKGSECKADHLLDPRKKISMKKG